MLVGGEEVMDSYPCSYCGHLWSDPVHESVISDYKGNKTISVTYRCRRCGKEYTKTVFRREVQD